MSNANITPASFSIDLASHSILVSRLLSRSWAVAVGLYVQSFFAWFDARPGGIGLWEIWGLLSADQKPAVANTFGVALSSGPLPP